MSNPQVEKVAEAIYKATGLPKPWEADRRYAPRDSKMASSLLLTEDGD